MIGMNNLLNTLSIFTTTIIIGLSYWARIDLPSYVSIISYFKLFALAAILFSLPDFLCYYFPSKNKWYRTSEFYTSILILHMGFVGVIFSEYSAWISFIILPIGIALTFWELFHFLKKNMYLTLAAGLVFMTFMILLFYSQFCHSVLFPEKIILGKAHIEPLFHSSMSNIFSNFGWPSTGLHGSPYISYHWGSHALFAGLKNWTGLGTLMFYNIAYPAIFLPLFAKSLFNFMRRLFDYYGKSHFNILFIITFMIGLFSLPIAHFQFAQPIVSESFCVAFVFSFLYASTFISYIMNSVKRNSVFYLYSLLTLILISFIKISNGFVCTVGMGYLYLRIYWNFKSFLKIFMGGIIITVFILLYVFQNVPLTNPLSLVGRVQSFWFNSDGFMTYFLGAFIALIVLLKNISISTWSGLKPIIKSREYIDLEMLFIITIAGFLGGIITSSNSGDVYYFCSIQFFFSIPYLIYFAQKTFARFRSSEKVKTFFLIFVTMLSMASRPDVIKGVSREILGRPRPKDVIIKGSIAEIIQVKKEIRNLTKEQKILKRFLDELFKFDIVSDKKTKCIYIPKTEKWYYESQKYRPLGSALVVPAISGIAMIGGVPDSIIKMEYIDIPGYGYSYFNKKDQFIVNNINEAIEIALKKGFNELIKYQINNGKLNKHIFNLKTKNQVIENINF